jgi:mono/diheme cytochrome c family protein
VGCDAVAGVNGSPTMEPGQDCMQCHAPKDSIPGATGQAADRTWTVAGTVFADPQARLDAGLEDAEILVTDDAGTALTLLSNEAGNFYTGETLVPPLHVQVQFGAHRMRMVESPPLGFSCNACHTANPVAVGSFTTPAPGELFVPTTTDGGQP